MLRFVYRINVRFQLKHREILALLASSLLYSQAVATESPALADNAPLDCTFEITSADFFEIIDAKSPEAMEEWPEAKSRFLDGLPEKHSLFVTFILFDSEGRTEYVFLIVDSINGDKITGRLWTDVLFVEGFYHGDQFVLPEDTIRDWSISGPGGTEEGNLISKYLHTLQQCAHLDNQSESSEENGS